MDISAFISEWLKAWTGNGNPEQAFLLCGFYSDDFVYSDPFMRNGIRDRQQLLRYFSALLQANPNWHWNALEIIPTAEGCTLLWEAHIPVGNEILRETGLDILEFTNNRISRNEVWFDRSHWLELQNKDRHELP